MKLPLRYCLLCLGLLFDAAAGGDELNNVIEMLDAKHFEQAKTTLYKVLARDDDNAEAHYYLGRTYFALCHYNKAVEHCKRAVELEAGNAEYHFWLARAYGEKAVHSNVLKQATLAPKIRGAFERAVELDPKNAAARYGLGSFYLQAPVFMGGDLQKAAAQMHSLLAVGAALGELLQARIYEKQGKPLLAEATYKKLQQRSGHTPAVAALHANYGRFLLERQRYREAIEQFQQQLATTPANAAAHKHLGDAYRAVGKQHEAATAYEAAAVLKNACVTAGP